MRLLRQSNNIYRGWWLAGLGAVVMALGTVPLFQGMPVWNPVPVSYTHLTLPTNREV